MLDVRVLGPIETQVDGATITIGSRTQRVLLAALVHARGQVVPTERLVSLVWEDDPPEQAHNSLKSHLSRLRGRLTADAIVARPPGYVLRLDATAVDVHRFEQDLPRARTLERVEEVLALWRGPPYGELADHEHFTGDVTRLLELWFSGRLRRADLLQDTGRHDEAVGELEAVVADDPLREPAWIQLLQALRAAGRQADAVMAARRYREHVAEVGLEPSPRFVATEQDVFETAAPAATRRPRLPARLTTVVGRDQQLRRLVQLLEDRRVVTLVGPGGVGKSTVAVEAARRAAESFPDGTWLASLADVDDPTSVVPAVVRAVGAPATEPLDRSLREYLARRHALLVLDNAEHVRGAVRSLVQQLAAAADDLRIITTSRQPLDLPGEVVEPVDPLAPDPALALFRERALDAGAEVTDEDLDLAAAVCERLDRLPLAIEMAAARLRGMGLQDLAARLDHRLRLLRSGGGGRHQTLGEVVEWSHDLLDARQQQLLAQLSVFAGPFDLDAAESVCAGPDVARGVTELVDRSLVVADLGSHRRQYRLLETVRSFASQRLARSDQEASVTARFVAHYVDVAERISAGLRGSEEPHWSAVLDRRTANLEAAHSRALELEAVDAAVRIAAAPYVIVYQRLRADIGAWAEATLPVALRAGHPQAPVVVAVVAVNRLNRADPEGAADLLADLPDDPTARHGHEVLGDLHVYRGDLDVALEHFARATELARAADDQFTARFARASQAIALGYAGRGDEGVAVAERVRQEAEAVGDDLTAGWCDYARAEILADREPGQALALVDDVVAAADEAGWRMLAGVGRLTASSLRARTAAPRDAVPGFQLLIEHWDRMGDQTHQWTTLRNLVELFTRIGAHVPAARLLGAVEQAPTPTYGPEERRLDEAAERLQAHLGDRFDVVVSEGRSDDLHAALDQALQALRDLGQ